MSEIELKHCPLCGPGKVSLNPPNAHQRYGSINCPACMLMLPGEVKDQRELIEVWNTRHVDAPSAQEPEGSAYDAAMTTRRRRGQIAGAILEVAGEEIMTAHLALKCSDAIDQNASRWYAAGSRTTAINSVPLSLVEQITDILADEIEVSENVREAAGGVVAIDFGRAIDRLSALHASTAPIEAGWREKMIDAVRAYHLALDRREHGSIACHRAMDEIMLILDMPWKQGVELARKERGSAT